MIQEIAKKYLEGQAEITRRKRIIERHENAIGKINDIWWGDEFIRPIMEAVKVKFPDLIWNDERLVPMGLRNAVSLFSKVNGETIALTFTPTGMIEGKISFDIRKKYDGCAHGFGHTTKVIEDIEEVFNYIQSKIDLVMSK